MSRPVLIRASSAFTCFALTIALAACGGGGSSDDGSGTGGGGTGGGGGGGGTTPPPVTVANPTATFVAPISVTAQTPVAFDASGSASADGSALVYSWDFGDGVRGGGAKIAHAFAAAGTPTVTLTVIDGGARVGMKTLAIPVAAAAAASGTVVVHLAVVDSAGTVVPSVAVTRAGSTAALGTTDASGLVDITLDRATPYAIKLVKGGYADQMVAVMLPATSGTDTRLNAVLHTRDAAQTLADAHAGGTLTGRAGATITLPADALLTAGGALATGAVPIAMTAVDPTLPGGGGFPGQFKGVAADATSSTIVSYGTVEFVLGDPAARMNLAPGKTATIEMPLYAAKRIDGTVVAVNDTIPLWSLDEGTGLWVQEGTGTIVANTNSPSGLAMRATVGHFSWWNIDSLINNYGPKPTCVADADIGIPEAIDTFNTATICNMLAEIDHDLGSAGTASKTRVHTQAIAAYDQFPGFALQLWLQQGAEPQFIPVPANVNVKLTATALNGTWIGEAIVVGPANTQADVAVKLRPINYSGPTTEPLTAPFDITRGTGPTQVARFSFTATATQYAQIQVYPAGGVTQAGTVRLLQGTTVLATASYDTSLATITAQLPTTGTYTLEIQAAQAGATRIAGQLVGGVLSTSLAFPTDSALAVTPYQTYQGGFDVPAPAAIHLAAQITSNTSTGELRLLAPDGSVLWTRSGASPLKPEIADIALPGAGHYTFQASTSDGAAMNLQVTTKSIDWGQQAEDQPAGMLFAMIDLVADRTGKPVMGFTRSPVVGNTTTSEIHLRRFNGTAWEDVGPAINLPQPCGNTAHEFSFAFDSTNTPTVAYATSQPAPNNGYFVYVRKLVAGVWQGVGANDGVLPAANLVTSSNSYCDDRLPPRLAIDSADRPVVAFQGADSGPVSRVQRFDGSAWGPLATGADDRFTASFTHDLAIGPDGTVWFTQTSSSTQAMQVRRFDATAGNWVFAGPNNGTLPETGTNGWEQHRIRFDSAGHPVVGGEIGIYDSTSQSSSTGVAVYRFNGTIWSTTGGYQLANSYVNQTFAGFTMVGDVAYVAWFNQYRDSSANSNMVVETNSPSGWAPVGTGADGTLTAYLKGTAANTASQKRTTADPRMISIGGDVYLSMVVQSPPATIFGVGTTEAVLLKLVR